MQAVRRSARNVGQGRVGRMGRIGGMASRPRTENEAPQQTWTAMQRHCALWAASTVSAEEGKPFAFSLLPWVVPPSGLRNRDTIQNPAKERLQWLCPESPNSTPANHQHTSPDLRSTAAITAHVLRAVAPACRSGMSLWLAEA